MFATCVCPGQPLAPKLRNLFGATVQEVDLVSPYFVPGKYGVEMFSSLTGPGVRVRVLTNALEATDVPIVHAGTRMQWVERRGNTNAVHDSEPKTGLWRRMAVAVFSVLPIEPLL